MKRAETSALFLFIPAEFVILSDSEVSTSRSLLHFMGSVEIYCGCRFRSPFNSTANLNLELNKLKDSLSSKTQQFEDALKGLMTTMAQSVQSISALKLASVDKVVLESNRVLLNILKAPYNHYSPVLEFEEIERIKNETFDFSEDINYEPFRLKQSSRVKFNMLTGMWTSEDGNITNMPFGVHQIHEEIIAPIVQDLMNENRIERLKIYNHIKDQKISYLNKWHQDTDAFYRANRAESADIINIMQESLREYVASYNTLISLKNTEESMRKDGADLGKTIVSAADNTDETLLAFELQSQEFQRIQNDFEDYMERLKEDIDTKASRFGHVEYYDARLRDGYSNEVAVASSEISSLDDRRKSLATVNPLLAKTSTLLPEPNVEDVTFEHIAINLPVIAKQTLSRLDEMSSEPETIEEEVNADNEYEFTSEIDEEQKQVISELISTLKQNAEEHEGLYPQDEEEVLDDEEEVEEGYEEEEEEVEVEEDEDEDEDEEEEEEEEEEDEDEDEDEEDEDEEEEDEDEEEEDEEEEDEEEDEDEECEEEKSNK